MDPDHLDHLARSLAAADPTPRRRILLAAVSVAGGLLALPDADDGEAKDRRRRRKQRHKRHKDLGSRKLHKRKKPQQCSPEPAAETCSGKCGAILNMCKETVDCGVCACETNSACGAGALCVGGDCYACDVSCTGSPAECGAALQQALDSRDTIYVCPGTYQGGFTISSPVAVFGAGQGDDPTIDTILHGNDALRVLYIAASGKPVRLERLRVTHGSGGGSFGVDGVGIYHGGEALEMRDCTIAENTSYGGYGSGINSRGTLDLTRCTIRDNHADDLNPPHGGAAGLFSVGTTTMTDCIFEGNTVGSIGQGGGIFVNDGHTTLAGFTEVRGNEARYGGGIYVQGGTLDIGADCRVTRNRITADGFGGGLLSKPEGTVILAGPNPSPIVVTNCPDNCWGNVPKCASGGICPV
ncbi:MAG: right-handed parallel beta-helix repeat-containing protein [Thermomicrobiales bacterium]